MRFKAILVAVVLAWPTAARAETFLRLRTTSVTTTGDANTQVIAGTGGFFVTQIRLQLATAVATTVLLQKTATLGTPTVARALNSVSINGGTSRATWALTHSAQPTYPTYVYHRVTMPATIGTVVVLEFPGGFYVEQGSSIALVNVGTIGILDVAITIEEQ